jgi:tRNA-splicing ligase RtcB
MMSNQSPAPVRWWLSESVDDGVKRAIERMSNLDDVVRIAVLPDVHVAGDICVGTATATRRLIYPAAVGGDIGCGMLALGFDTDADALRRGDIAGAVLRSLCETIPASRRLRRFASSLPEELRVEDLSTHSIRAFAKSDAGLQLGTVGGGNHFVELQSDEQDQLWLMIHTGSRAIGQAVRNHHVAGALALSRFPRNPGQGGSEGSAARQAEDPHPNPLPGYRERELKKWSPCLDSDTSAGQAYLNDAAWASRYAAANRARIAEDVIAVLREVIDTHPIESTRIECDHNHVRHESHDGERVFVHRKGAMSSDAGVLGVLPGSMGTLSYHVEGRGNGASLRSSAHGAGRRMSRAVAREKFASGDLKHQLRNVRFDPRQTKSLIEEAPHAYKDVRAVLRAQEDLVRVVRTLKPVLVFKGG